MQPLLIIFIQLGVGGVQRKIVDICNFLQKDKPDLPIYIVLRNRTEFDLSSEIKNPKVKILYFTDCIHTQSKFFWPFYAFYTIWQIWEINPQSVLAFLDMASVSAVLARLLLRTRKFILVLSENHFTSNVVPNFTLGRIRNHLIKIFYPFADTIFACSQAGKRDLIQNYRLPAAKIRIFRSWTAFDKNGKWQGKYDKKKYDLVYVGRFYKTKNLGFLIKSVSKLKEYKKNIKLLLLGSGQEENNLRNLVRKNGLEENVEFHQPTLGIKEMLIQAKVLVLTSQPKAEGFPMTIMEAMAVGTPVLTRAFAGAEEFLKEGENCYLFKNKKEFIKRVLWLLDNESERQLIAHKAYQYVKRYHSPKNIIDYLQALKL